MKKGDAKCPPIENDGEKNVVVENYNDFFYSLTLQYFFSLAC